MTTLEELVQEMGRAGRNGNQSHAILCHKAIGAKLVNRQHFMEKIKVFAAENCFGFLTLSILLLDVSVVIYVL